MARRPEGSIFERRARKDAARNIRKGLTVSGRMRNALGENADEFLKKTREQLTSAAPKPEATTMPGNSLTRGRESLFGKSSSLARGRESLFGPNSSLARGRESLFGKPKPIYSTIGKNTDDEDDGLPKLTEFKVL